MYLFLLILWFIFNGKITMEITLLGLGICGWLYWFMCKHMDYSIEKEKGVLKRFPGLIKYLLVLVWEIVKANMAVIKIILSPKAEIAPEIVTFETDLETDFAKVGLANSITLTPGTFTIQLEGNRYMVHALDQKFGKGLDESVFVKQLRKLEG